MTTYAFGTLIRFSVRFTQKDTGALIDPSDVIFKLQIYPADEITKSLSDGDVIRDGDGSYHVDYTPVSTGVGVYAWEGTGDAIVATQNIPLTVSSNLFE